MEKVVYADVLFFMNFGCDLITVCLTSRLCRTGTKILRASAAAAVGALTSVPLTLLFKGFISLVAGVPIAALMCVVAFGSTSFPELVRRTAIMWSSACLLYGAAVSICSFVNLASGIKGRIAAAVACAISVPAVFAVSRIKRDKEGRRSAYLRFSVCGVTVGALCLIDSGNLLTEPVSGDPVAFVASSAAARLPPDVVEYLLCGSGDPPPSIAPRIRIIPAKSLTGEGLFRAIRPDVLFVNGTKRSAYISLREAGKGSFAAYDGVIPPSLT
ncbi:MAG: sigma-E processing peptidase SpoIIGA [Clostridia bacterium]|nr:sigma-E processing peptidase SpoIIGA [Clostridia bacterium]